MEDGLAIAFDTYDNGGDTPSIEVFADGVSVGNFPQSFTYDSNPRLLSIQWDASGLDLTWDGNVICSDLPTPGFVAVPGNRFAFSARTGGATQTMIIDDLLVTTTTSIPLETGGPVISEFLADNSDSLEDEDTDSPDWVEIYNGQNATASMSGWQLRNTTVGAGWSLPAFSIPPYGHVVIYCSGKNRSNPLRPLHTNFSLAKNSGTIALIRPNASVASEFNYGPQFVDDAYGLKGPPATFGFLESPTPGRKNASIQAASGPAEDVVFLRDGQPAVGGLFSSSFQVTFQAPAAAGAVIRYTLNNTAPSVISPVWTPGSNFTISETTNLRARVYLSGSLPGEIKSLTYLKLDASLTNYNGSGMPFSSHLPIIVFDSFGIPVDQFNQSGNRPYRSSYAVVLDRDPLASNRALITGKVDMQNRCGTRVRGETSAEFDQRSYAWEIWDNENEDKDVSILGMPSESDWVLHGPFTDKTLMRNYTAYQTMRDFRGNGSAMRTRFVEVFFNQEDDEAVSADDYKGIYVLTERIKRDADRVDVQKLNSLTTDPAMITGGYIFRKDKPSFGNSTLVTPGNSSYPSIEFQGFSPDVWNPAQQNYLQGYLSDFENALYGAAFDNPTTGYAAYIDVDSFIDNQWWVEITKQIDGYRISQYFTKDRGEKIKALPIWDYNLSFSNADFLEGSQPTGWYYPQLCCVDYYWYPRLHQDVSYVRRHWDRYWEMRRGLWGTASILNRIDAQTSELLNGSTTPVTNNMPPLGPLTENAAMRHFRKYPVLGTYLWPNAPGFETRTTFNGNNSSSQPGEVEHMKNWLSQRLLWIDDQNFAGSVIYRPPFFSQSGGTVIPGTQLVISRFSGSAPAGYSYASGGTLYYTTNGNDPAGSSPTPNAISPSAIAYSGPITLNASGVIKARLLSGGTWSPMTSANFLVGASPASSANLVISEIHYSPSAPNAAEITAGFAASDFEYIELLNVSQGNVDLSGCDFTVGITFDFDLAAPSSRILAPGGRIVVAGNSAAFTLRYGTLPNVTGQFGGNLNNGGERLTLLAANASIISNFIYGVTAPWPPASSGYSLVLNNPASGLPFDNPSSWRASAQMGGTPGAAAGPVFLGSPAGDSDGDGLSDFLEFGLGSSQGNPASAFIPSGAIATHVVAGVPDQYLTFSHRRNLAADGVNYIVELSLDFATWGSTSAQVVPVSTVNNNDGTATMTYRAAQPERSNPQQFMRLRLAP